MRILLKLELDVLRMPRGGRSAAQRYSVRSLPRSLPSSRSNPAASPTALAGRRKSRAREGLRCGRDRRADHRSGLSGEPRRRSIRAGHGSWAVRAAGRRRPVGAHDGSVGVAGRAHPVPRPGSGSRQGRSPRCCGSVSGRSGSGAPSSSGDSPATGSDPHSYGCLRIVFSFDGSTRRGSLR